MNKEKGFSTILVIIIGLLVIGGGAYLYLKPDVSDESGFLQSQEEMGRWETDEDKGDDTQYVRGNSNNISKEVDEQEVVIDEEQQINENATGIIKSVYSKNGKNFLTIDYVIKNSDWKPGGNSGPAYNNENPKIRTFEISDGVKIYIGSGTLSKITYAEFSSLFVPTDNVDGVDIYAHQYNGLWDIKVTSGIITEIREYFLP